MKQLTDNDRMPWGKYRGVPMSEVPVSYLHFLWTKEKDPLRDQVVENPVADYIKRNMDGLKDEDDDLIWE